MSREIWTIGHSNRTAEEFVALLEESSIALLADVRRFPGSRAHPHFGGDALEHRLAADQIAYRHFPALGGRRGRSKAASPNTGWRVAAFNAYADHMQTPEFESALGELTSLAQAQRTCIMCAEALPWRCHRRLISDVLVARGWTVHDIMGSGKTRPHTLTAFAQVDGGRVTYPSSDESP
jgi:uncharacterized protein (DUF488 family)